MDVGGLTAERGSVLQGRSALLERRSAGESASHLYDVDREALSQGFGVEGCHCLALGDRFLEKIRHQLGQ